MKILRNLFYAIVLAGLAASCQSGFGFFSSSPQYQVSISDLQSSRDKTQYERFFRERGVKCTMPLGGESPLIVNFTTDNATASFWYTLTYGGELKLDVGAASKEAFEEVKSALYLAEKLRSNPDHDHELEVIWSHKDKWIETKKLGRGTLQRV